MADDFAAFHLTTKPVIKADDDYNNILAHALEKTAAYVVRKNSTYYEAILGAGASGAGKVTYGGEHNAGTVDGTDYKAVAEAAITAAAGGHIHFAGADVTLTDEIAVGQANTWLTGDGWDTKLTQSTADKDIFTVTTKTGVRISNMYLYGTGSDSGCGIVASTTATDLTVDHVKIENMGYHGIQIVNCAYPKIVNCIINSNIRNGVDLDTVTYGLLQGNKINTNTRHGVWMDDSSYNILLGNRIYGNDSGDAATYDGVNINHSAATSDYNLLVGNIISENDRYELNISTANCTGTYAVGNNLYGTTHTGEYSDSGTASVLIFNASTDFIFTNDLDIGAHLLKTTNLALKEGDANTWHIKNAADTTLKHLACGNVLVSNAYISSIYERSGGEGITFKDCSGSTVQTFTLGVGVTTLALTNDVVALTGDGGGNNLATITGGIAGQKLVIICTDANVTFVNDDTHAANTIDLVGAANLAGADDTVLTLVNDGTSWYEVNRSVN